MKKEIQILNKNDVDVQKALENFLGDEELYVYCVKEFLKDPCFARLKTFLKMEIRSSSMKTADFIGTFSEKLGFLQLAEHSKKTYLLLSEEKMKKAKESFKNIEIARGQLSELIFEKE